MALQRDWRPDPTGRHPFRELRGDGRWGDMVAASESGDGMTADIDGGRLARGDAPASAPPPAAAGSPGASGADQAKRSGWVVVGVVAAVIAVGWWLVDRSNDQSDAAADRLVAALASTDVELCWSGTAAAVDLTVNVDGSTEQASSRANGQCITKSARSVVVMSVQNTGAYGTVRCEIRSPSGTVLDSAMSTGAYVIASCNSAV